MKISRHIDFQFKYFEFLEKIWLRNKCHAFLFYFLYYKKSEWRFGGLQIINSNIIEFSDNFFFPLLLISLCLDNYYSKSILLLFLNY